MQPWRDNARWLPGNVAHEREYVPYADATTTVSGGLADLLRTEHGLAERPAVVLNAPAVDELPSDPAEPAPDIRARCGLGPDEPLLVYSGVAAAKRGLGVMVEALPRLPGAHVAFVVNKPDSAYVRGLVTRAGELGVADRVEFLGFVRDLNAFYGGCHVFALPSTDGRQEGFGLVLLEAMACGRPVVTTPIVGIARDVEPRDVGILVPPGDPAALAAALRSFREKDLPAMGRRARELVEERYGWERITDEYERLYRELLPTTPG